MAKGLIISLISAYLLGSIPVSYIFGKLFKKVDIREHGSGNVGATNAVRVLGPKIGLPVLALDIFKGAAAVLIGRLLVGDNPLWLSIIGFTAIMGHNYTVFLGFKGGKGVATSTGVFLLLTPISFSAAVLTFIVVTAATRYVSLGSILAGVMLFVSNLVVNYLNGFTDVVYLVLTGIVATLVVVRHHANIKRLLAGTENKLSFKSKGNK